jgi:hypothetical protein
MARWCRFRAGVLVRASKRDALTRSGTCDKPHPPLSPARGRGLGRES